MGGNFDLGNAEPLLYEGARLRETTCGMGVSIGQYTTVNSCTLGDKVAIQRFNALDHCSIGSMTYTGRFTTIIRATVGAFCGISWNVSIGGANHDIHHVTMHDFTYNPAKGMVDEPDAGERFDMPCTIGNDVWIGAGAIVNRGWGGISIGDGAVIGSGAVVTHDIPPYAIAVGCPARVVGQRFDDETISRLLDVRWWEFPFATIRENVDIFRADPKVSLSQLEVIRRRIDSEGQ